MARARGDDRTLELLDWRPPAVAVGFEEVDFGRVSLRTRISQAIGLALDGCGMSRDQIAEQMTDRIGVKISKATVDAYAAPAKENTIPLDRFITLIEITGCHELLGFVAERFGFVVVPERYRDLIELHQIEEHEREIEEHERQLEARKSALQRKWRRGK